MTRFPHVAAAVLCLALGGSAVYAQSTFTEAIKLSNQNRNTNLEAAEDAARKAIELAANNNQKSQGYQQLASVRTSNRKYEEAIAPLEQAAALEDVSVGRRSSVLSSLGQAYILAGQVDKGREVYNNLIADENATPIFRARAQIAVANTYINIRDQRDPAKAREMLQAVEKLSYAPVNEKADARHVLGALEASEKNFDVALKLLTDLQKQENLPAVNRARYRITLANAYRQAGQPEKSIETYQAILDDEAATTSYKQGAHSGMATVYMQQKDYDNAKKAYQALVDFPGASQATVNRAKASIERIEKLQAAK